MEIVLLVGPPGSGKSTLAHTRFPNHTRISQDDQGKKHMSIFETALTQGQDIVIDRMNHTKAQRDRYLAPAKAKGYTTRIIVLHESYSTCYDRAVARENHPSIKDEYQAAKALSHFFKNYERVQTGEADYIKRAWSKDSTELVTVFDIDGTLADCSHRMHFIQQEKKDWKAFFDNMSSDKLNEWCYTLYAHVPLKKLICTARPNDYSDSTINWLERNVGEYDSLHMRYAGDHRPDYIVKEILLEFEILTRYDILFWVDDSPEVVKMLRSHGITVLDCGR